MKPINILKHKGNFFTILQQTDKSQIGVMTLRPKSDSGPEEIHDGDQIVYIIEGEARIKIGNRREHLTAGMILTIPTKTRHHIYNDNDKDLFFLTVYAPPAY